MRAEVEEESEGKVEGRMSCWGTASFLLPRSKSSGRTQFTPSMISAL